MTDLGPEYTEYGYMGPSGNWSMLLFFVPRPMLCLRHCVDKLNFISGLSAQGSAFAVEAIW